MTDIERDLFVIVARAPIPGQTKTRLGRGIGMDRAAALYAAFLHDLTATFRPTARYDLAWAHTPESDCFPELIAKLRDGESLEGEIFLEQEGTNLYERLTHLFRVGKKAGYRRIAIVASDSPHLRASIADLAFAALGSSDLALGRVLDGGYYLIGVSAFHDVLSGLEASTSTAADAVAHRAKSLGLSVAELPVTFDVDEVDDLRHLHRALELDPRLAPATRRALRAIGYDGALHAFTDPADSTTPSG